MSTNAPGIKNTVLQQTVDLIIASVMRNGAAPSAAPNAFKTRLGQSVTPATEEFEILIRTNPDGETARARVSPIGDPHGAEAIVGEFSPTGLGSEVNDVSTGTATLSSSTVDVTVTPTTPGTVGVPTGSAVYATVTTAAGKPKLLSAVRVDDNTIRISSTGSGFGALLASAGVDGTLSSGAVDITLANVAGDKLAVVMKTSGGTPGVLSVKRKSDTEVTVQSWLSGTGIQALDTSVVTVYNFGQAAHETSLVRWAVVRP